jgi:DNA modification methylase
MRSTNELGTRQSAAPAERNLSERSQKRERNPARELEACLEYVDVASLKPHPSNPRLHSSKQIKRIAESIRAFGFRMPVVIDATNRLICGHARVEACKLLGIERVPALRVTDLSEDQIRGLLIADNRLTELSTWDDKLLAENLKLLSTLDLEFDIETIGFDYGEIEQRILTLEGDQARDDEADQVPDSLDLPIVTRVGDLWRLGPSKHGHRILCADSREASAYERLLSAERAAVVFTDPPYNLPARAIGQVCAGEHGNFEMAAGEMTSEEFQGFLATVMKQLCRFSEPGSIHYIFMDWRHSLEILQAGKEHYSELKNLCVWLKDRPGMGTFYRSQHELVFVFKRGEVAHQNNFELGQHGRTRSNVWSYPSIRSAEATDGDPEKGTALSLHPTVKPVRLIEDALLDCSQRGELVLDPFLGSGSTLIACEKTQRILLGIEISPRYVDVAIGRWEAWTGADAIHEATGKSFKEIAKVRREGENRV